MKPKVFFFGGFGANTTQVNSWVVSALNQRSDMEFKAFPYLARHSDADSAVLSSNHFISEVTDEIKNNSNRRYIIVGHSSGAAISNKIAALISNIELIVLDGFVPSHELQKRISTVAWYAANNNEGILSRNANSMKFYAIHSKCHISDKKTPWALHFSLVNDNVPDNLSGSTFLSQGYANCHAFLGYLDFINKTK